MAIELDDKIVGIWFVGMDKSDFLAAVREIIPEEKYELKYRFRYYEDDKAFDSADRKHWYQGTVSATRNYAVLSIRKMVNMFTESVGGEMYELLNDKGFDVFVREFKDLPFHYVRLATPEQRDKIMKEREKNG